MTGLDQAEAVAAVLVFEGAAPEQRSLKDREGCTRNDFGLIQAGGNLRGQIALLDAADMHRFHFKVIQTGVEAFDIPGGVEVELEGKEPAAGRHVAEGAWKPSALIRAIDAIGVVQQGRERGEWDGLGC